MTGIINVIPLRSIHPAYSESFFPAVRQGSDAHKKTNQDPDWSIEEFRDYAYLEKSIRHQDPKQQEGGKPSKLPKPH